MRCGWNFSRLKFSCKIMYCILKLAATKMSKLFFFWGKKKGIYLILKDPQHNFIKSCLVYALEASGFPIILAYSHEQFL